jgi:hypothetical protein
VRGVQDAGKGATLNTSNAKEIIPLPTGTKITTTETPAVPAKPATATAPAEPAQPAKTVTIVEPGGPTEWIKTETTVNADTGAVDTSVAKHRIDVEERRWLLWAALGCGVAGVFLKSMLPAWPGLSNGLLLAAGIAFVSWKVAALPEWLWIGVALIFGAKALGYKKAEWDKNGDGIPDVLQK